MLRRKENVMSVTKEAHQVHEPEIVDAVRPAGSAALVERPATGQWAPSPLAELSDDEFARRLALVRKERVRLAMIQRAVMTEGVDYGVIPGTPTPTLLKPGAEILNKAARLKATFGEPLREAGDGITAPHIRYQVRCLLVFEGEVIAEGDGSSNSLERKHRYRSAERVCPHCGLAAIIKGRQEYGGGWLCFGRKGGCGAKFGDKAQEIVDQSIGVVENPDPHDLDNTLLKMAEKRALVAATLLAHAASGIFTQDLEDADMGATASKPAESHAPTQRSHPAAAPPSGQYIAKPMQSALHKLAGDRAKQVKADGETIIRDVLEAHGCADESGRATAALVLRTEFEIVRKAIQAWLPPESDMGSEATF